MTVVEVLRWLYGFLEYPFALLLIIPCILFVVYVLRRKFVDVQDDKAVAEQKRKVRRLLVWTRSLMIVLLCCALASPFIQKEKVIEGDPFVHVLVDNSTSMAVFESVVDDLVSSLEKKVNTEVVAIGSGTISNIGDSVLNNLGPQGSILLVSDGQVNSGSSLGDVALFASKLNTTISAVKLNVVQKDASVRIVGPSKVLEDAEVEFSVVINKVGRVENPRLIVTVDGELVQDGVVEKLYLFKKKLGAGVHRIVAKIESDDFFPNNNVFYKTVKVVPKPKVIFLSESASPLEELLKQVYVVERQSSLPASLAGAYAVVVNNMPAAKMNQVTDVLNDFIADGNGMVVIGGENSYDKGAYRNSLFESLLPVQVGRPEKKEGDVLVAILIDISGSQGSPFGRFASTADFSKSATIDIIRNLKLDTRVAVLAFNTAAYLLSEPTPVFSKSDIEEVVARLKWGGGTNIGAGLLKATSVLNQYSGSKNIVLLSDGKTQGKAAAEEAAKFAYNNGVKVYTVGVGPSTDEEFMMRLAELTNGIYFRATEESKLRILFGPVDELDAQTGQMELVVLNGNHFITENFEPKAALYGFNQVSPKGAGRLLATTSTGEPVLTVWRLGLGRVAALSVDDGSKWAGSLLNAVNSKFFVRTFNWVIGDPERKSASFIDATDTRINEPSQIVVRSSVQPTAEKVVFYKLDEETYSGSVIPTSVGFHDVAGAVFAVNYEAEFGSLGVSDELQNIVASTGGKMFSPKDVDKIVQEARAASKRVVNSREYVRWPFVVLVSIVFLLEIFIRRVVRRT